jgi:hypothetical protein
MQSENSYQLILRTLLDMREEQGRVAAKLEAVDEKVDSVLVQTTKTNGRLTKAENDIEDIKSLKNKVIGGSAVACVGISALWSFLTGKG